jgi:galactose-inhibitable lectin light subunit
MFKFTERNNDNPLFANENELFDRNKCKTCCKVLFVSDYNPITKKQFTQSDDLIGHIRYTMDMEFDDKRSVRDPNNYNNFYNEYNGYQQHVVVRPISIEEPLQYFEFSEYNMYKPYLIPRRVFDIQGGVKEGRALILYMNKWGNEDGNGVKNQQFKYVHDYTKFGYYDKINEDWKNYPNHFFLPNTTNQMLCFSFEDRSWNNRVSTNTGNKDLILLWRDETEINNEFEKLKNKGINVNIEKGYQIISRTCSKNDARQIFIPVFI